MLLYVMMMMITTLVVVVISLLFSAFYDQALDLSVLLSYFIYLFQQPFGIDMIFVPIY